MDDDTRLDLNGVSDDALLQELQDRGYLTADAIGRELREYTSFEVDPQENIRVDGTRVGILHVLSPDDTFTRVRRTR